jgi:hypothetical protein
MARASSKKQASLGISYQIKFLTGNPLYDFLHQHRLIAGLLGIALLWCVGHLVMGSVYQRGEIRGPSSVRSSDSPKYDLKLPGYVSEITWHLVDGVHLRELESRSRTVELQSLMPGDYQLVCVTSNLLGHKLHSRSLRITGDKPTPHPVPAPTPRPCCEFDQLTRITAAEFAKIRGTQKNVQAAKLSNTLKMIADDVSRSVITDEQDIINQIAAAYKAHTDHTWSDARRAINDEVKHIDAQGQITHIREWASVIMAVVDGLQMHGDRAGDPQG